MKAFTLNKWEYRILEYIPLDDELDELGLEGWEMCGIHDMSPDIDKVLYYFKRKCGELVRTEGNTSNT